MAPLGKHIESLLRLGKFEVNDATCVAWRRIVCKLDRTLVTMEKYTLERTSSSDSLESSSFCGLFRAGGGGVSAFWSAIYTCSWVGSEVTRCKTWLTLNLGTCVF